MLRRHFMFLSASTLLTVGSGLARGEDGVPADPRKIIFLADTHIGAPAPRHSENLRGIVSEIISMNPRPGKIFILGDLAFSYGKTEEYQELKELLAPVEKAGIPIFFVVGNHDTRERMFEVFPEKKLEQAEIPGKQVGIIESEGVDFLILDSRLDDPREYMSQKKQFPHRQPWDGTMEAESIAWMEKHLPTYPRPLFVLAHHPISQTKIGGLLEKIPAVQGYLFGHEHKYLRQKSGELETFTFPTTSQRIHGKAEPNGFMELNICPEGFEFTLCALNDSHPLDGRKEVLPQKKI